MSDETENMEVEKVEKPQKPKGPSAKGNISEIGNRDIRQQHYKELKRAKKKIAFLWQHSTATKE